MIYLSAQPDNLYFLWQLELQLFNFHQLGIPAENIHVLIGYDPRKGLLPMFETLIKTNGNAHFFCYPDNRSSKSYASSIRPHLIKQHLCAMPHLSGAVFFYHDSDILFSALPDFTTLCAGKNWYVSDTRTYLDAAYIINKGGEDLMNRMCSVIGISPAAVLANTKNAGGAQYLIKNSSYEFWDKVEKDCEEMYQLLNRYNNRLSEDHYLSNAGKRSEYDGIKAWCTDMWVLLWNALLYGHPVKIHEELAFCWPKNPSASWDQKKILHYTGVSGSDKEHHFFKDQYRYYSPYFDDFRHLKKGTCSYRLFELIRSYKDHLKNSRIRLQDVTFMIPVRIDSEDRLENLSVVLRWLDKFFDTNIIVYEADRTSKLKTIQPPDNCRLFFEPDNHAVFHRTKYNNIMVRMATTPIVAIYDADVILNPDQILAAVKDIRQNEADFASPYSGECILVDALFKAMFSKILDTRLLERNAGKSNVGATRAKGGVVFLKKDAFVTAGMENEFIDMWGPEDAERMKRMYILGYSISQVKGPLFHLHHQRNTNSGYNSKEDVVRLMKEYLKICTMDKAALKKYIASWPWINQINVTGQPLKKYESLDK